MVLLAGSSRGLSKAPSTCYYAIVLSQLVAGSISLKLKVDLHKPSFQSTDFPIELILNNP